MTERKFAYDTFNTGGVQCPIGAAGLRNRGDPLARRATFKAYDKRAVEMDGAGKRVLPEDQAKQAFLRALDDIDDKYLQFSKKVAERLGWL